jgi:heterodisulfide reductase subunit A2
MTHKIGKTLVKGGGISGIKASLDLAQAGYQVLLVEASDHLGGLTSQLDRQFPAAGCGMCRMLPLIDRDQASRHCLRRGLFHENIETCLSTDLVSVHGEPGDFTIALQQQTSQVNPALCIGCGQCEAVCPTEVPDPFNAGLTRRKAIYRPCPQSFSYAYAIDVQACTGCRACAEVCPTHAIQFVARERETFHVLVVDDEKIVRDSMKEWLTEEGYQVHTAGSGQKALDLMAENHFHMMLTDIKMPGMDGVELLTRAKALQPDIAVVMMTAYAAVESAVAAMKQGALEYVIKPFAPETVLALVDKRFGEFAAANARKETVDALILASGSDLFTPDQGINPYGYGRIPGVVTSLEFERMLSAAGPGRTKLVHPVTGRQIQRIAWFQCVGSRDLTYGNPFCSSVCCMISIKQSMLAKTLYPQVADACVFYMDMRTPGKDSELYADQARQAGVNFVRARVHSLAPDATDPFAGIHVRWTDLSGKMCENRFDLVVLAVGQNPDTMMQAFAGDHDIDTDAWGFVESASFAPADTSRPGIFACGTVTGPKDIQASVIQASAAAMSAMETMAAAGRQTLSADAAPAAFAMAVEQPRIMVAVCQCNGLVAKNLDMPEELAPFCRFLAQDPEVVQVQMADRLCEPAGRQMLGKKIEACHPNRLVVAACGPCMRMDKIRALAELANLPVRCVAGVDVMACAQSRPDREPVKAPQMKARQAARFIQTGISRVKTMSLKTVTGEDVVCRALVVGGGIAGMTAALAIAGQGYAVDLVEKQAVLGGNLIWLHPGPGEGRTFLEQQKEAVLSHALIQVHTQTLAGGTTGRPGQWKTRLIPVSGSSESFVRHGVVVLAVGGTQADPGMVTRNTGPGMYTQQGFQQILDNGEIDTQIPLQVAMIQCWGSREKDRNYCSRVCCPRTLEQALFVKDRHPDTRVMVFFRDMMTPGVSEDLYTRARQAGIVFVSYEPGRPPVLDADDNGCRISWCDVILGKTMEMTVDYAVLATGVTPQLTPDLAGSFGARLDPGGFFDQADIKWQPVEALQPRVLACGLCLAPGGLADCLATARAAAARAVAILSREQIRPGRDMARVKTALCSLCQVCIPACPYGARQIDPQTQTLVIDPLSCQSCGICAAMCPSGAAVVDGLSAGHMLDIIHTALSDVRQGDFYDPFTQT